MQPYRAAAEAPPPLVYEYRPLGKVGAIGFSLSLVVVALSLFGVSCTQLKSSRFHCERAAGVCALDESWPIGARHRRWPIDAVFGARLTKSRVKSGVVYTANVIVKDEGEVPLVTSGESDGTAVRAVNAISAFVASSAQPSVDVQGASPSYATFATADAIALFTLYVAWILSQTARVVVDRRAQTLSVLRRRWPLSSEVRQFPLRIVRDAYVEARPLKKGGMQYRVSLMIDGAMEPAPLLEQSSSGRDAKDRDAAAIRAMLDEAREDAKP